jgi:Subtilase family
MDEDNARAATRECPYCREPIRIDATKCRYCASSLAPTSTPESAATAEKKEGEPGHVIYVLDKDLIRFGKVAAAFLSLIIVVGAALTGLDLKHAVSDANSAASDASAKLEAIKKTEAQTAETKKSLDATQAALKDEIDQMHKDIAEIREALPAAREIAASYKAQTAPENTSSGQAASSTDSQGMKTSFTGPELSRLYNFPQNLNGEGQNIALIELGGGYRQADLDFFFASLKIPVPSINWVSVDGAKNEPTNANSADGLVDLEIEVTGAVAPKAHLTLYFTPNTNQGFADAIRAATADKTHPPTVIQIGWGAPEKTWTAGSLHALDDTLHEAATRQITVVVAAGDSGPTDGSGARAVDYPSSSPWVVSVGGTRLNVRGDKVLSEVVWNQNKESYGATGGGVSHVFPQPDWQFKAHIPPFYGQNGRGIPDVAANGDPSTGYLVRVDGTSTVMGGTTAATALWAGFVALINQGVGRNIGYINPILYQAIGPSPAFNDITVGNNSMPGVEGGKAGPGWDYCTGWGTPNGTKLLEAFRKKD